jgi:CRISPR-associated protein Cas2
MSEGRRRYIVAYDIRNDKRLRKVAAAMNAFGWRMQYSVFIADLDQMELIDLQSLLASIIHHGEDSLAFIDVGQPSGLRRTAFSFMGRPPILPTSGAVVI